ncbi:MAG: hypothetical protein JWQ23_911 [Herminiimonas sp.]|nr:hypothetical protein [Herminiimonas sp.]
MKKFAILIAATAGILSGCVAVPYNNEPVYGGSPVYRGDDGRVRGDRDRDGVPNRADRDRDGDGVPNRRDNRPNNPNRY